ncbi:MAG: hypothetical protein WA030_02895 [Candidatus Microsaccharimonas sp.]
MRSLRNNNQTTLFAESNCDADKVSSLVSGEEKVLIEDRCAGDGVNIIDCHHPYVELYIQDVGKLDMNTKALSGPSPLIQQNIPIIPRDWFDRPADSVQSEIVGIKLKDLVNRRPRYSGGYYHVADDVKIDLSALTKPIFANKKIILFADSIDVLIETLWWRRIEIDLFKSIAAGNFYAVAGMNFSLFMRECPLAHLININKSLAFVDELSKLGIPVIPHIYAVNDVQRQKWVHYLVGRPHMKTVTINTQMQRSGWAKSELKKTILALLANTRVNIVLNGRMVQGLPDQYSARIFVGNQSGLIRRAIIENAQIREAEALMTLAEINGQPEVRGSPNVRQRSVSISATAHLTVS